MTAATIASVAGTLGAYWKFPPRDDELEALANGVAGWESLQPLADAVDYATRNHDDRPSVAWLLREARRRRDLTAAQTAPKAGCHVCRGDGWTNRADISDLPQLVPCPRCRKVTHELREAGAYALDAPRSTDPRFAHILAKHDM